MFSVAGCGDTRRPPRAALALGLVALVLLPAVGRAQEAAPAEVAASPTSGFVTARTLGKSPDNPLVFVSPYDDSELNLKLKADFESRLAETGKARLAAKENAASYLLLFETEVMAADQAQRQPSLGTARADQESAEVNVNVWSTTQDSVLGGRQAGPPPGSSVFHINAVLRDQKSGEVVWQGDAYYVLREPETERVARGLVSPLVTRLGETVAREPIEIE